MVETLVFALSMVTGPLLSRALGDAGRGTLAAVLVPTQLAGWALALGVPYASAMLSRRFGRNELIDAAWGVAAVIGIPVGLALFVLGPALLDGHPAEALSWYRIGIIGTLLGMPVATLNQLWLMRRGATWVLSAAKSSHLLLNVAAVVALAVAGRLTLGTALASWLLAYLLSRSAIVVALRGWPRHRPKATVLREQLRLGRVESVVTVASISLGRIDQVFLAFLVPRASLGQYAVAATAAQVSLPLARAFADVVLPDVFNRPGRHIAGRATALVLVVSTAIGALSALSAPWVVPALFGEAFEPAVSLLWLLIPGQVLYNTAWVISARFLGAGRPGVAARAIGIAAVVNAVALWPAIAAAGTAGAAMLTSVCQGLYLLVLWLGLRRDERSVVDLRPPAEGPTDAFATVAGAQRSRSSQP